MEAGNLRLATGSNIVELERNANEMIKNGYEVHGIVQQITDNGKPVLIWPMKKAYSTSGPMTR